MSEVGCPKPVGYVRPKKGENMRCFSGRLGNLSQLQLSGRSYPLVNRLPRVSFVGHVRCTFKWGTWKARAQS